MRTQEGGGSDNTEVTILDPLMGLGTARMGTWPAPLALAVAGDLILEVTDT
jgi:hypothetical protein